VENRIKVERARSRKRDKSKLKKNPRKNNKYQNQKLASIFLINWIRNLEGRKNK